MLAQTIVCLSWLLASLAAAQVENTTSYNIVLRFETPVDPTIEQVFVSAKTRWESIIVNDIDTSISIPAGQELCGHVFQTAETVDDLLILVNVPNLDGPGNVLAQAGPCGFDNKGRVRVGIMSFDLADLQNLIQLNRAEIVVLHEMGHVSHRLKQCLQSSQLTVNLKSLLHRSWASEHSGRHED